VGEAARRCVMSNAPSTFASIKRLIGRTASADELLALAALEVPYRRAGSGEIMLP
jgi:molecular chaperone DnaK (HSP70)